MFARQIKLTFRNLLTDRVNAFINIGGLAFSMTVAMLIGIWINDELNYNHIHHAHDRIAKFRQNQFVNGEVHTDKTVPMPLADELKNSYGKYFDHIIRSSNRFAHLLDADGKKRMIHGVFLDAGGPDMLGLEMLAGSRNGLQNPTGILIAASVAKAYFGNEDPIDKIYRLDNSLQVKVTGVYSDLPANSTFATVKFIAPFALYLQRETWIVKQAQSWYTSPIQLYVQVAKNYDVQTVSDLVKGIIPAKPVMAENKTNKPELLLEPMNDWHLYADFENGHSVGGKIRYVWMFGIIGIFILLLACINFMNLTTAKSAKHARDTGIRKTIGASRTQLIAKFYIETLVLVLVSFVSALILLKAGLPFFNGLASKQIPYPLFEKSFWFSSAMFIVSVTIIAGSYPAVYLSSFRPIKVLKAGFSPGMRNGNLRRSLVVFQFTISITLIILTVIISRQIEHGRNRSAGYDADNVVQLYLPTKDIPSHFDAFRNELQATGAIQTIALSQSTATDFWGTAADLNWPDKDPGLAVDIPITSVSADYGKTLGWELTDGRDFSNAFKSDSTALILTESASKYMELVRPVGETIRWNGQPFTVIGIIKDLVIESPFKTTRPSMYSLQEQDGNYLFIKLNPGKLNMASLELIEPIIKKFNDGQPFDYRFVSGEYDNKFSTELKINNLANLFAVLATVVCLLGLFGLTSFVAEQRSCEISVRKLLGASVIQLWALLTSSFIGLVLMSCLVAVPLAWLFANQWLQQFEYRAALKSIYFLIPVAGALLLTLLVVTARTLRSALSNPVKNLKSE